MSAVMGYPQVTLRPMCAEDLSQVLCIEQKSYRFPWSAGIFKDCVRVGYVCKVCELDTKITGYAILSIAAGECHLLNLCVDPDFQGRGLGRLLLKEMIDVARASAAQTMFLEVRASNEHAVALYLDEGFNEIGVRTGYYPSSSGREDAIIYAMQL